MTVADVHMKAWPILGLVEIEDPLDLPCVGASSLTHDTAPPPRDAESVATIVGSGLPAGHGPGGEGACPIRVDSGSLRR